MKLKAENQYEFFDAAVVGGGLGGLSLSILLAKAGYKTVLFEKNKYPFHKVCGEYISRESVPFLRYLGLKPDEFPVIEKLEVTSPSGRRLTAQLDLGGIGVSRFVLDNELKDLAEKAGVKVLDGTTVNDASLEGDSFEVRFQGGRIRAAVVGGCFGKRSKLDIVWKRKFAQKKHKSLNNFIGIKYHVSGSFPGNTIWLHNFKDGYCGMSKVEGDLYCLCYLTTSQNLKKHNNAIEEMEKKVLAKNPFLKEIFAKAGIEEGPVTISQISFEQKEPVENHVLMVGDAAGMITPLCGNGMSMSMNAAKLAFLQADDFLSGKITRTEMENRYREEWLKLFSNRMRTGRRFQKFFGRPLLTEWFIFVLQIFPFLKRKMISMTHGKEF